MTVLQVPHRESPPTSKHFIHLAVCELKFPTLLEFGASKPAALQRDIKPQFPLYEREDSVNVGPDEVEKEQKHLFRSRDKQTIVAFKNDALAVETRAYTSWEEFSGWIDLLVRSSKELIESPFYTRVGLRYVNRISARTDELRDWINGLVLGPLASRELGTINQTLQEIRGNTSYGGFTLRHGFVGSAKDKVDYLVDIDCYQENLETTQVMAELTKFHDDAYDLFAWTLGPKGLANLQSR